MSFYSLLQRYQEGLKVPSDEYDEIINANQTWLSMIRTTFGLEKTQSTPKGGEQTQTEVQHESSEFPDSTEDQEWDEAMQSDSEPPSSQLTMPKKWMDEGDILELSDPEELGTMGPGSNSLYSITGKTKRIIEEAEHFRGEWMKSLTR